MIFTSPKPSERGWIDFDIQHTYPTRPVPAQSAQFAVEQTIRFPVFDFKLATPPDFEEPITGPLQFSSVYVKTVGGAGFETATGIALHVENEKGHRTYAEYDRENLKLSQVLRNSIHLKGVNFVRPGNYILSGGDAFGFGGNGLYYRLRAFQQKGAAPNVPVGWYDVADIYRDWLGARYAAGPLYRKLRPLRPNDAPADDMAPHTAIPHWGIDGAIDPIGSDLNKLLELHPLLTAADGHETDPRLSLVELAQKLKAAAPKNVNVEVQPWGIEMAGFFQFICGYPHLADVLGNGPTFGDGVTAMAAVHAVTTVTTDPLNTTFDRKRFAGHIHRAGGS